MYTPDVWGRTQVLGDETGWASSGGLIEACKVNVLILPLACVPCLSPNVPLGRCCEGSIAAVILMVVVRTADISHTASRIFVRLRMLNSM